MKTVEEHLRGMEPGFRVRGYDYEADTVVEAADLIKEMREALEGGAVFVWRYGSEHESNGAPAAGVLMRAALMRAEARNG
jgi:hypothetical protein